jgi:hypothetical protein
MRLRQIVAISVLARCRPRNKGALDFHASPADDHRR